MKLIMENWKRFLKEDRNPFGLDDHDMASTQKQAQKILDDHEGDLKKVRDFLGAYTIKITARDPGKSYPRLGYLKQLLRQHFEEQGVNPLFEQDESMSAEDLGRELRSMELDTKAFSATATGQPVISMKNIVELYGDTIEKAAKALDSLGKSDLAQDLRDQLGLAGKLADETRAPNGLFQFQKPGETEMFYDPFNKAGDALLRAKRSKE